MSANTPHRGQELPSFSDAFVKERKFLKKEDRLGTFQSEGVSIPIVELIKNLLTFYGTGGSESSTIEGASSRVNPCHP